MVASGKRSIKRGSEYDSSFTSQVEGKETVLLPDGDVYDTLKLMKDVVTKTRPQTSSIATKLKGNSIESTSRNVWTFLYNHVQYKKDNPLREQLRTPARTWKDRTAGVDCDCYSIFISSVLTNLGIPHSFRMAGYDGDFQHVYVVVPKNGKSISDRNSYYVIDPVVDKFNYEAPFRKKHDNMAKVTMLNGLNHFGSCENAKPTILKLRKFIPTQEVVDKGGVPTREFLVENNIEFAPSFDRDNDRSVYVVSTAQGLITVPTVISPIQAQELKAMAGACATPSDLTTGEKVTAAVKKFPWWMLAIGAGVWILFTGSDQNEVKSGLDGLKSKKKKDYKSISI